MVVYYFVAISGGMERRVSNSAHIDYAVLQQHFHLPISQVAKELGVCATVLKKLCRQHGIPRWPHRKVGCVTFYFTALKCLTLENRLKASTK